MSDDRRMANRAVAFKYSECDIRITNDGEVIIKESKTE